MRLNSVIGSDDFDIERLIPLLTAVLNKESDEVIWDKVYTAVTESTTTPSPRPPPNLDQTPILRNTSSFLNSSEHRKYVDSVLREELESIYVGVPGFYEEFFGDVENLQATGLLSLQDARSRTIPYLAYKRKGKRGLGLVEASSQLVP